MVRKELRSPRCIPLSLERAALNSELHLATRFAATILNST